MHIPINWQARYPRRSSVFLQVNSLAIFEIVYAVYRLAPLRLLNLARSSKLLH